MIAQFAIAGAERGPVIGTHHAVEALMGFFTKFGGGAADTFLVGSQQAPGSRLPTHLFAPPALVGKVPTADLENLALLRPDENTYGVTYDQIDDFLEGNDIGEAATARILQVHAGTPHKRAFPLHPAEKKSRRWRGWS